MHALPRFRGCNLKLSLDPGLQPASLSLCRLRAVMRPLVLQQVLVLVVVQSPVLCGFSVPAGARGSAPQGGGVRVNKVFTSQFSRREADRLIADGRVSLNGAVATPGDRVRPGDNREGGGESPRTAAHVLSRESNLHTHLAQSSDRRRDHVAHRLARRLALLRRRRPRTAL